MSDETTPDLTQVLAEHFVMWHDLTNERTVPGPPGEWRCQCGLKFGFSDTAIAHLAEQITAAGFGPVRGVEAERDAAKSRSQRWVERYAAAHLRAESAEAALAGLREGIEALAREWEAISGSDKAAVAQWHDAAAWMCRALLAPTRDREEARDE